MSEQHEPTVRGERAHKWIMYGSIFGVALVTLVLTLIGVLQPAVG